MNRINHRWGKCFSCEQTLPIWPETDMCGPCTTGEASTLLDEWHEAPDEDEGADTEPADPACAYCGDVIVMNSCSSCGHVADIEKQFGKDYGE